MFFEIWGSDRRYAECLKTRGFELIDTPVWRYMLSSVEDTLLYDLFLCALVALREDLVMRLGEH